MGGRVNPRNLNSSHPDKNDDWKLWKTTFLTYLLFQGAMLNIRGGVFPSNKKNHSLQIFHFKPRLLPLTRPFSCSSPCGPTAPKPVGFHPGAMTGFLVQLPGGEIRFVTPAVDVPEEATEVAEWVTWNLTVGSLTYTLVN